MDVTLLPRDGSFTEISDVLHPVVIAGQSADIAISGYDLELGDELQTALIISLFTHRRAAVDDPVPLGQSRRGWWADTYNELKNDKIGSRLWLLNSAKTTNSTLVRAREYVLEALRWLIEDGVASNVTATTEFLDTQTMAIQIIVQRSEGAQTFNFSYVWGSI